MRSWAGAALMGMGLAGACWIGLGGECAAQGVEGVGVRALGMGGAFVAIADDATATYWNPAGLATGALVSAVVEQGAQGSGEPNAPPLLASQRGMGTFVGLSLPPIGLSYYRLRTTRLLPPGVDPGTGGIAAVLPGDRGLAASLVTQHVGVTLVQSVGQYLDVAGTITYVHGSAAVGTRDAIASGTGALDRAEELPSSGSSTVDVDLGALAHVGAFRAGLVVRNLRQPSFDVPGRPDALRLDRQVRVGAAWQFAQTASSQSSTTVSCDVDLTRTETELDVRRHVAVGAEHLVSPRLAVRGGFRINTVADARPTGSAGVSVAVRPSIWVDAQITRGARLADRAWGVSARFGF